MESDLPLIEMDEEDDSLIQQFPDLDQTSSLSYSILSPFALPPSHSKNLRDGVRMEKPSSSSLEIINNKENINSNSVEVPKLGMEPMQMKRRKKVIGYNLRKSLAWDRAFFTDEGILDPLDLTLLTGIDANTHGGGLPTLREEGSSSFSSNVRCTDESNDMEASEEAPLKELRDKNRTTKGNREKTSCLMRNHDSLLHHKVTHKVLSSNRTYRGGSKLGGFSEPLAASSLKRPANLNTLKTAKKESKLPKLPISNPGPCLYATKRGSMAASQLRHNLIPKPTEKNSGLRGSLQNAHGSQTKAKRGSGNLHLPVKEIAQKTVKKLTHSSKAASSLRSELVQPVQVDRANSLSELVHDGSQVCKVLEESTPLAAKHLAQHAAANSYDSLPEATRLTSSGSCHIQRASKGLMISDRLQPFESPERPAEIARPSGLRLPSPSLRLFDMRTASVSSSLQQKKIQQYMGSDRKTGEPRPPVGPSASMPMKSNDLTECCAPSAQLSPSPNYTLNTSIEGVTDSHTHQILVTKAVPRGSEQHKKIFGHEEKKVSHPTEQLTENVELISEGRVPETNYKSTSGKSIQHQEENISTGVNDLAQTSWGQADAKKSVIHLDAGSQVFMESQEQDEIGKRDDDVGITKCVAPGVNFFSVVMRHGQENNVSKVIDGKSLLTEEDDSSCSRKFNITLRDSDSLEEGTFPDVTDTNDHISQEKGVSSAILMEVPGKKQDKVDVDLIPRDDCPLTDDKKRSSGLSPYRPHVEIISETASLGDDTFVKKVSTLQGAQCTSTYPQSLEKERVDLAAPTVKISQDHCGIISVTKPAAAVHGSTGGLKTCSQFQSENETLQRSGPISNISKTSLKDGQVQLLDDLLVQSCSSLTLEVNNQSIENADHSDVLGKQGEFSSTGIKLERVSQSNEYRQQESVCEVVWNVVEGNDVYECDPKQSDKIIVDTATPGVEVVSNIVIDSSKCHENYSGLQLTESDDFTLNLDSELEPSVEDKTFVKSSGKKSCSLPIDSTVDQKTTLFLDDQVLINDKLLSTEKILDSVVPEVNANVSDKNLTTVQVNGDDQPHGFDGIMSSVETYDCFTNEQSDLSLAISQQLSTSVKTTSTPEFCCLIGEGDESLLTKTAYMIGTEGSKMSIREQVDATPLVGEFQLELDDFNDQKDATLLMKSPNSIKRQDISLVIPPPNAVPFSDEWLAAIEAAGEEILTMKRGAVQHSPQDKSLPEPSPWSPVKRKANQIGPFDCTKHMNAMSSNSLLSEQ